MRNPAGLVDRLLHHFRSRGFDALEGLVTVIGGEHQMAEQALGHQIRETIVKLLHSLAHSADTTVIVVTHDPALASQSDRTFQLKDGRLTG